VTTAPNEATEALVLKVGGKPYQGWTEARITRALDKTVSDFDLALSERWPGQDTPWPLLPFTACQLFLGTELLLTGYID
jgi:prophage tail gpP-like protein